MTPLRIISAFFLLPFLVTACDTTAPSDHVPEPVVESYLVADALLPPIRLFWTTAINDPFDFNDQAIRNATVRVILQAAGQSAGESFSFHADPDMPGVYVPDAEHSVVPLRTYALDVTIPGRAEAVSATTIIPGRFEIVRSGPPTVVYQGDEQYSVDVTQSVYPGRQTIFVLSIEALEPGVRSLTPLYLSQIYGLKPSDSINFDSLDTAELEDFLINASPPFNEQNYEMNADGTLSVPLPWFGVVFFGDNLLATSAVDDSIYDFMRYQLVQQGGSTLSPGEIPNVLDHVGGGRGVFGSMARVESVIRIVRK